MKLGPIPGESLTRQKGNSPWEAPPQFPRVDQAFKYYVEKLEEDDYLEDVLTILDLGLPLDLFVDSILINGEMKGRHFVDINLLLGPLLHEYILGLAEAAGVEVVEFVEDLNKDFQDKDVQYFQAKFKGLTEENEDQEAVMGLEALGEATEAQKAGESFSAGEGSPEQEEAPMTPPSKPTGLIKRPMQ